MSESALRKACIVGALLSAATLGISACGGGTVEEEESVSSVPKISKTQESPSSSYKNSPIDGSISEIKKSSEQTNPRSAEDKAYLKEIGDAGIKLDSTTGDQLISAAKNLCTDPGSEEDIAVAHVNAIAGQIVAQKLTKKKPEEVAKIITESAEENYCK